MDMSSFGLDCNFPVTTLSQFSRLQYLQLYDNPSVKVGQRCVCNVQAPVHVGNGGGSH